MRNFITPTPHLQINKTHTTATVRARQNTKYINIIIYSSICESQSSKYILQIYIYIYLYQYFLEIIINCNRKNNSWNENSVL